MCPNLEGVQDHQFLIPIDSFGRRLACFFVDHKTIYSSYPPNRYENHCCTIDKWLAN